MLLGDRPRRLEGRIIVRLAHLIRHIFRVDQTSIASDDKHGSLQEPPFFNQYAVIATELLAPMRRKRLMGDSLGGFPARLGKR